MAALAITFFAAAVLPLADASGEPPRIVKWRLAATVTELYDSGGVFPDVRLGDPVRGSIMYDPYKMLNLFGSIPNFFHAFSYPPWLEVASMVVENSRTGDELRLVPTPDRMLAGASLANNVEDEDFGATDGIFFLQSVLAPPGFAGSEPGIAVGFFGPPTTFEELPLDMPDEIVLSEWPEAAISFLDLVGDDEQATAIVAEIYALTPVVLPPGDFNGDERVDEADLQLWQSEFGYREDEFGFPLWPYADADLDGDADGNDFLAWQQNLSPAPAQESRALPEPASGLLALASLAATPLVPRRHALKVSARN